MRIGRDGDMKVCMYVYGLLVEVDRDIILVDCAHLSMPVKH